MKLSELRPCICCGGKVTPVVYLLRISQAMIKPQAANQVLGLTQMFGGSLALAEAMCPEPEAVVVFGDEDKKLETQLFICQQCYLMEPLRLPELQEKAQQQEEALAENGKK